MSAIDIRLTANPRKREHHTTESVEPIHLDELEGWAWAQEYDLMCALMGMRVRPDDGGPILPLVSLN